jgi:DNA-directed RNA polymerase II subunit RPB7
LPLLLRRDADLVLLLSQS